MILVKILGSLFLLFAISRVILRWREHRLSIKEFFLWLFIFGGILIVLLIPHLTNVVAQFLGIGRGSDIVIYSSIALLFYLVFRVYVYLENIEYRLTQLVREHALVQSKETSQTAMLSPTNEKSVLVADSGNEK